MSRVVARQGAVQRRVRTHSNRERTCGGLLCAALSDTADAPHGRAGVLQHPIRHRVCSLRASQRLLRVGVQHSPGARWPKAGPGLRAGGRPVVVGLALHVWAQSRQSGGRWTVERAAGHFTIVTRQQSRQLAKRIVAREQ